MFVGKKKINQLLPVQQQQPGIRRMLGSAQAVLELQEAGRGAASFHLWQPRCC